MVPAGLGAPQVRSSSRRKKYTATILLVLAAATLFQVIGPANAILGADLEGRLARVEISGTCHNTIQQIYPGAVEAKVLTGALKKTLDPMGVNAATSVYAVSTCPDEVNRMLDRLYKKWGDSFHLSGLAGIPFTGRTGMAAYASHVPDNGALVILFAPHIGITSDGVVGKVKRPGMANPSGACGSVLAALRAVQAKHSKDYQEDYKLIDPLDLQQPDVERTLDKNYNYIANSGKDPVVAATDAVYSEIKRRILQMIPKGFRKVVIVGGVQINTDRPGEGKGKDYFHVRDFLVKTSDGPVFIDKINDFNSHARTPSRFEDS
ncbi:hypothetical protein AAMO2058_000019300 [Amorphochlora amoebiformis]|mmetsp:Transcript_6947/g.10773  ORF Transcript_6947/g.10773 Transcript_6947/m.10773 type:complete len:320 (-) Transcript_6947:359-1318(-)